MKNIRFPSGGHRTRPSLRSSRAGSALSEVMLTNQLKEVRNKITSFRINK